MIGEDGSFRRSARPRTAATALHPRADVAGQGRLLRWCRLDLAVRDRQARTSSAGFENVSGRPLRLLGAHRVSPRRPHLRAAAATAATPTAAAASGRRITCSASRRPATRARSKSARQSTVIVRRDRARSAASVTYSWAAPTGTFTNRTAQNTPWTAPNTEGPVPVTVTVTCPTDGKTASDTVNIQVVSARRAQVVFEDVHFDFDRYWLRPEAMRALDEAIAVMQQNASLADRDRGPHLQHRHGRVQPRARRPSRQLGARLPDQPRHRREPASAPSATVRSGPSTTTRARRPVGSTAARRSS